MPLVEHLMELRKRLMWAAVAILVGGVAGWFVSDWVLQLLTGPLLGQGKKLATINFGNVTSAFDVRFEIAIIVGIVITSPIWLFQIFAFLTPAFTRQEKKYVFGFFFSAVPLFLAGCAAGALVIPHIVGLMVSFAPINTANLLDGKAYLDFVLRLILVVGVAFVLPVFVVLLNFVGVLQGRTILKSWRIAILAVTIFTAIATPSADIISMVLLAIPMIVLYFVAVAVALVHDKRKAKRDAAILEGAGSL
ncbi:twin-arginine translocase subunit TatC [Amnibacterium kyonggiense]|uniref:Sec-independent protein translocase protein TatC n=1 Tax=Amnibacterium kyonggiense TaxID=595671 RepID=A0A4R7FL18_9MICO|nr:twin-arginine translocase subunit TatC [Amnibacterium kyonggiense]TDS77073.1 sec-independent protein translocase protein TatC [Amnibacterium kyonggiense]